MCKKRPETSNTFFPDKFNGIMEIPSSNAIRDISNKVQSELKRRFRVDESTGTFKRKICCVCETIHVIENPVLQTKVDTLKNC